jgi:serine/threonine protein phosphatase PrpC
MKIRAFGRSEKGLHLRNQDAFLVDAGRGLFAVADGVTVSRGRSEKASREAVRILKAGFRDLESAFLSISKKIAGMKDAGTTTLTVALVKGGRLEVGHVGDSCLFIVRGGVKKITEDDSVPGTNVLTQVMGGKIKPHFYRVRLKKGDCIVLATDGVAKYVGEREMLDALAGKPEDAPQKLISAARRKPKLYEDDKTVVVIKVDG